MDSYIDETRVLKIGQDVLEQMRQHSILARRLNDRVYPFDDGIRGHPFYPQIKTSIGGSRYTSFLDLGCGPGSAVRQVLLAGMKKGNVRGIDSSRKHIEQGFTIYQDSDVMRDNFIVGDALSLRDYFSPESFDYVYSSFLLHLLRSRENIQRLVGNAHWALRQDGTFFGRTKVDSRALLPTALEEYMSQAGFTGIRVENREAILYFYGHKLQQSLMPPNQVQNVATVVPSL